MAFVVVKRLYNRATLLSDHIFDSRDDALLELTRVLAEPTQRTRDAGFYVLDVELASPVLVMELEPPACSADEPIGVAEDFPDARVASDAGEADITPDAVADSGSFEPRSIDEILLGDFLDDADVAPEHEVESPAEEPEEPPRPEMPGYEAQEIDITSLTCEECVYVDSCPNKDERTPAACGSFQWVTP